MLSTFGMVIMAVGDKYTIGNKTAAYVLSALAFLWNVTKHSEDLPI